MNTESAESVRQALAGYGALADSAVDLAGVALLLAAVGQPGIALGRYQHHLEIIAAEVGARHRELLDAGAAATAETRLAALKHILGDKHGYQADGEDAAHIQNANLIRVIDRRKGNSLTLGILYLATAKAQGWAASGLGFPGYFLLRLEEGGQRLIFDPFHGCKILQAADLRRLVKQAMGPQAELSVDYYEAATHREILVRLQNQIKLRQIEAEDYEAALQSVEAMRAFDPGEFRLLLDAGVLYARTGRPESAIAALEDYIGKAPNQRDRQEAALLLRQIRDDLN